MFEWFKKKQTVEDVVHAYGVLLEKYPLAILDVSMLPAPKTKMKALLKTLYAKTDDEARANQIEIAFIFLSNFQDGVGPIPIENSTQDMKKWDKWLPWEKLSFAEMEILLDEWKRSKEGEPI
jgi:hypothetical protein